MADETKRIVDLTESNTADSSIYLPTDSSSAGTNKIAAPTLVDNAPATFTTSDVAAANATAYTDPGVMTSGENRKTLLQKISQMAKNVKYLYKMLGTTDISSLGGGTVTGALSTLNTNIGTNSTAISKLNTDFSTLDLNAYKYIRSLTSSDDLNNIKARGFYAITTKPSNSPVSWASLIVTKVGNGGDNNSGYYQTIIGSSDIYLRAHTGNPLAWTDWVKMPTRSEIDKLNSNIYLVRNITYNTPKTFAAYASDYIDIDTTYSGYLTQGIVGVGGSGTGQFALQDHIVTGDSSVRVYYRNLTDSEKTLNRVDIRILYKKV